MLLSAQVAVGDTIYNNTVLTNTITGLESSQSLIQIDDVLVPSSRNPYGLPLSITSITVDLSGYPGATGPVDIYFFPVLSNGTPNPNFTLIDSMSVTFTGPPQLVTFGDGSDTLITVDPNFTQQPGFGLFYIGLSAKTGGGVGWLWANGPDYNLPTAYLDNLSADQIFLNTSPGPPFPPNDSFYLDIGGSPVPEPSSLLLLISGILGAVSVVSRRGRRRRDKSNAPICVEHL
jgi:hypothetical protein